jgi:hypothetical protein
LEMVWEWFGNGLEIYICVCMHIAGPIQTPYGLS